MSGAYPNGQGMVQKRTKRYGIVADRNNYEKREIQSLFLYRPFMFARFRFACFIVGNTVPIAVESLPTESGLSSSHNSVQRIR